MIGNYLVSTIDDCLEVISDSKGRHDQRVAAIGPTAFNNFNLLPAQTSEYTGILGFPTQIFRLIYSERPKEQDDEWRV
jgi:hypothetical protein